MGLSENNMLDLDMIADQVRKNCDISDAHHAGLFSICGLALRLRDLYKWENKLPPWVEKDSSEILDWIDDREQRWDKLIDGDYKPLSISGRLYDPFDTEGINVLLEAGGLFYGAGYARGLKPTFFLTRIDEIKRVNGHTVYLLGRELARDLLTLPALTQDSCVLLRQEAARLFLWDSMFYIKKSGRKALAFALENCGLKNQDTGSLQRNLAKIFAAQKETYIYHEVGELRDTVFDGDLWREVIAAFPRTPVELLARSVKDLLADTNEHGTLNYIIRERKQAALGFYVAFFDGLAKEIFPELRASFEEFARTLNWQVIEKAVTTGYNTAKHHAETIVSIFQAGKEKNDMKWAQSEMEKRLLCKIVAKK